MNIKKLLFLVFLIIHSISSQNAISAAYAAAAEPGVFFSSCSST